MTKNPTTAPLDQGEQILKDAWKCFDLYDRSAIAAQKRFVLLRKLILILGVASTTLAVLHSTLAVSQIAWIKKLNAFLYFPVVLTPIIISILLAGAVKFDKGVNWILLRASAEAIKREIYFYRAQVGIYKYLREAKLAGETQVVIHEPNEVMPGSEVHVDITDEPSQTKLARAVKIIGERLMKTQVNQASLKIHQDDRVKDSLPEKDDQFSLLNAQKYLNWRLIDQLSWYRRKSRVIDRQLQWLQWAIFISGGVGTFLAAIKLEVWIAVSNAVAAALVSFLEFKQLETTLTSYNQAANNLENILYWWHALSPEAKEQPENFEKLVENTEAVIQNETTGWVQEMRDALAELYSKKTEEKTQKSETKTETDEKAKD